MRLPAAVVALLFVVPRFAPAQPMPALERPGIHFVEPTGTALALEARLSTVESKRGSYYCYLEGAASPTVVAGRAGLRFFVRELMSRDDIQKGKLTRYKLEDLAVKDGRRYGTKAFVDIEIVRVGEPEFGKDPDRKKDRGWVTFALTPRTPLAPGEYAFSMSGLVTMIAGFSPSETLAYAFRVDAAPVVSAPTPPPVVSPPANSSTASLSLPALPAPRDAVAQYNLGIQYRDGAGVPKDFAHAAALFKQAAEQGLGAAQANLGYLYATGNGVLQDFVLAYQWLNIGASRLTGVEQQQAAEMRDQVAARMTPTQIADGQKLAREWLEAFGRR